MITREVLVHVFIQWLASKEALDELLNFVIEQKMEEAYTLKLQDSDNNLKWLVIYLPDWQLSAYRYEYWYNLSNEWEALVDESYLDSSLFSMHNSKFFP